MLSIEGPFIGAVRAQAESDPAYARAAENVARDVRCAGTPLGNLGPELIAALDAAVGSGSGVLETVQSHCCHGAPHLHRRWADPPSLLLRVMSWTTFITWHLCPAEASALDDLDAYDDHPEALTLAELDGSTGQLDRPSWWTFEESTGVPGDGGLVWMEELGLSATERRHAELDGRCVALGVPSAALPGGVYKPTSLEGYGPNTLFFPDLSDAPHGWTRPTRDGLRRRPEVTSRSERYADLLPADLTIPIRMLKTL